MAGQSHTAPEVIADLMDRVTAIAKSKGIDQEDAEATAMALADELAEVWGGQLIYFPKGMAGKLRQRDLEIYGKFRGDNHAQLASEYDLAVMTIYAIIRRVTERLKKDAQGDLFGG